MRSRITISICLLVIMLAADSLAIHKARATRRIGRSRECSHKSRISNSNPTVVVPTIAGRRTFTPTI